MMAKPARQTESGQEGQGAFGEAVGANRDAPAGTDWLLNLLTVSGPAGEVARFRDVARGTGGVPWYLDLDHPPLRWTRVTAYAAAASCSLLAGVM